MTLSKSGQRRTQFYGQAVPLRFSGDTAKSVFTLFVVSVSSQRSPFFHSIRCFGVFNRLSKVSGKEYMVNDASILSDGIRHFGESVNPFTATIFAFWVQFRHKTSLRKLLSSQQKLLLRTLLHKESVRN